MDNSPESRVIRQRMEEVRGDLDVGFQGMVKDAHDIGDWTYYVKTYPWAVFGVAIVAGYFILPRLGYGMKQNPGSADVAANWNASSAPPSSTKSDVTGKALGAVGNLVMRGLTAYAARHVDRLFPAKGAGSAPKYHP